MTRFHMIKREKKKNLSRSVWYYPLRLDAALYIEVVFNQIAPDYLEGLLLVLPGEHLPQEVIVSENYPVVTDSFSERRD